MLSYTINEGNTLSLGGGSVLLVDDFERTLFGLSAVRFGLAGVWNPRLHF